MLIKRKLSFDASMADNLGLGIFRYAIEPKENLLKYNSAFEKILGYFSPKVLSAKKLDDIFDDAVDRNVFLEILKRRGSVKSYQAAFKRFDDKKIWVAITARLITSSRNKRCFEAMIQDITAPKKFEDKLLMEKNFFENLLENIPDAVYFKDKKNKILKVNNFYVKGVKLKKEQIIGKTDFDFFPYKQAKGMFDDDNKVLETGKPIVGKIEKTLLSDGTWNQVITTKIPMRDRSNNAIGTMGITRDMTAYAKVEKQRLMMLVNALEVLVKALEMRDPYTFSHARNVARIAAEIGKVMGWDENRIMGLTLAGKLHDLGKIAIPLDILNKPGKLSDLEYRLIQEHVTNCYNLIKDIEFPFPLADIVYQHHEHMDGTGYPRHLKEDEILEEARVLVVSDVLEAMTHQRPYREALGLDKACEELKRGKYTKYDARIVDVLLELLNNKEKREFWIEN